MLALDIDGNGWSDRLRVLALSNTPVLKQVGRQGGGRLLCCTATAASPIAPPCIQAVNPLATSYLHFKQPATVRSHTQSSHPPTPRPPTLARFGTTCCRPPPPWSTMHLTSMTCQCARRHCWRRQRPTLPASGPRQVWQRSVSACMPCGVVTQMCSLARLAVSSLACTINQNICCRHTPTPTPRVQSGARASRRLR